MYSTDTNFRDPRWANLRKKQKNKYTAKKQNRDVDGEGVDTYISSLVYETGKEEVEEWRD